METRGIELAAQYIAKQFRDLGLITNLCDGTPFQEFQATARSELGADNRLALTGPASGGTGKLATHELTLGEDFTPLAIGGSNCLDLPLVFAGYGVTDKAAGYDDYAELNVAGKAVVVLRGYPWRGGTHEMPRPSPRSMANRDTKSPMPLRMRPPPSFCAPTRKTWNGAPTGATLSLSSRCWDSAAGTATCPSFLPGARSGSRQSGRPTAWTCSP